MTGTTISISSMNIFWCYFIQISLKALEKAFFGLLSYEFLPSFIKSFASDKHFS